MSDSDWEDRVRQRLADAWGWVAAVEDRRGALDRSDPVAVADYTRLAEIDLRLADAWTRMAAVETQSRTAVALSELAGAVRDIQQQTSVMPQQPQRRWRWSTVAPRDSGETSSPAS